MEHYPYGLQDHVNKLLNRYPHVTERDMKKLFITQPPEPDTYILSLMESRAHNISISRETEKQQGREDVKVAPLLHVHSVHVQPKNPEDGPLLVFGTIQVQYQNIISGEKMHLDVYKRGSKDADYISPSGGNLILLSDIFQKGIMGYDDLWMTLYETSMEVDLYLKIGDLACLFAQEKFLVGGTIEGDVDELRSKEFQNTLCSATLSYIKMPFATLCGLDVQLLSSKNESLVVNLAGKMVARYKNSYGNYNLEPCVLFEKQNGFEPIKMGNILCMSRRLLGLPAYSSLELELDLTDFNKNKHIKEKFELFNEDSPYAGYYAVDVEGDFAISLDASLSSYSHRLRMWSDWDDDESNDESSLSNNGNPRSKLIPSSLAEFYSIFIGRQQMGSALKIFGSVEFSSGNNTHYLFKRTGNDGVEIEDSQEVLPLRDVHMRLDEYNMPELKVDLKDVGGKFRSRGFASRGLKFNTKICSVFLGEEGFCALHYSIFSMAFQAKIKIFVKNKSDDFRPDIVYGSAIAYYSTVDYPTEFEKNYFRSVLVKRTEKDSVRLKDNGRVPLSRCVVAVPMDLSLIIEVNFHGKHYHFLCTEAFKVGISSFETMISDHVLDIKLTWSDGFCDGGNDSDEEKDCRMGTWSESSKDKGEQSDQLNGGSDLDKDKDCRMGVVNRMKKSTKRKQPDHLIGWSNLDKDKELPCQSMLI